MKISMGKSGFFDSTFFGSPKAVLSAEDIESKIVCFAFSCSILLATYATFSHASVVALQLPKGCKLIDAD